MSGTLALLARFILWGVPELLPPALYPRLLVEDEHSGPGPLAEAAGPEGASLYKAGDLAAAGLAGKPQLYLIKKVGMFPDVSEALAMGHLGRGDTVSAGPRWYISV